jgi:hypothetical protein
VSNQAPVKAIATVPTDEINEAAAPTDEIIEDALDDDLLRGGKRIAKFNYGSGEREDVKRLYAEAPRLPVFQEVPGGPLLAFKSKLRAHYEALSAAKELAIAEAAVRETQISAAPAPPPRVKTPPKPTARPPRYPRSVAVRRRSRLTESVS